MSQPFTIIIPTMWVNIPVLSEMLQKYEDNPLISEVLIINNDEAKRPVIKHNKVRMIGTGQNIYVNPAWNLGVKKAKTNKLIIANDDILIEPLNDLMELIDKTLTKEMVIGIDINCYPQKGLCNGGMRIEGQAGRRNWGFGTFIAIYKSSFIPIPDWYKILYGDDIQYKYNRRMVIKGIEVVTRMSETVRSSQFRKVKQQDIKALNVKRRI